ncbi:MAG: AAA family ATPase [Chloroflexi bacterium]|nr:AAA family ATPase [Chloroflexota bacterium]
MPIKTFRITNAGPFDDITFEFDERVNVLVGPNNSGKSTALLGLAAATVHPFQFPQKLLKGLPRECIWNISLADSVSQADNEGSLRASVSVSLRKVNHLQLLGYTSFIPSIRKGTEFRAEATEIWSVEGIPIRNVPDLESNLVTELTRREELAATDADLVSDEAVIRRMVDLDYLAYLRRQPEMRRPIEMIAKVASDITEGFPIEYLGIAGEAGSRAPEFRTPDGALPLSTLSQGTQSIMQWLARFVFGYAQYNNYPGDLLEKPAVLIVDEIDVHLHPSWQRRIIPALTKNFPNLQIFCSTHSPLMLAGLSEGQVQLLNRDTDGRVTVSRNRWDMAGWSAEEILRSVLGLTDTIDLATASEIDRMGELSIKEALTDDEATELEGIRSRVEQGLLDGPPSSQVESFRRFVKEVYSKQAPGSDSSGRTRPRVRRKENGSS